MKSKRWVVVVSPQGLEEISAEQLELGNRADYGGGQKLLVYRDSLVAYKVAARTGGKVVMGRVLCEGETCPDETRLADGERVRLESRLEPAVA